MLISLRNRLRHFNATVDQLTARMFTYEPSEPPGIRPSDTARFGILLGGAAREHG
ncbi:hypothetical protein KO481_20930 [Nocardia sp. NEAU-G5]|uniref:Uncharacterized protein n=1 Tax=Nocardia albiluteola TaxID=2842303 RepID=A0ABS6B1F8_9NOCA|nr:hypothetical protein [Nocardia albiluteola]MBU3063983.1 hypothetical protein [Nocardia albiluteola]